jgi:hypothetical protein
MQKEQIEKWLSDLGKDRQWLAEQCGTSVRTVESWFSKRGFTTAALKQIERLHRETTAAPDGRFRVSFDTEEFERIDAARKIIGEPSRPNFYRTAIIDCADRILAAEAEANGTPTNITPLDLQPTPETPPRKKKSAH